MAISINWLTGVISVPQADLTPLGGGVYEFDTDQFRQDLKDLEDDPEGMPYPDTHNHNTTVTVGGITLGRVLEILPPYTVEFEDGQYAVNLVNTNNNIPDVAVVNQVSIRSFNSAGLQVVSTGSGLSPAQDEALTRIDTRVDVPVSSRGTDTDTADAVWDKTLP